MDLASVILLFTILLSLIALGVPIAFALLVSTLPVIAIDPRLELGMVVQRTYNSMDSFLLIAVPFFLLAGNIMNESGVTRRLVRLAYAFVGHIRGGLAHVNVVVSMLFAGISGSSTADTAGVGSVLIPAMKEKGYSGEFSVAITAASSVMGIIIPPSLILIVWGAITGTSVASLFAGGVIPGFLIGISQMLLIVILSKRRQYPVEKKAGAREMGASMRSALLALLAPLIIVGGIMFGLFTPTEASVIAVLYSLFLGVVVYRTLRLRIVPNILHNSARLVSLSLFCVGTAGMFGWMLAYYRVPYSLAMWASTIENPSILLLVVVGIFLVLGTFLDGLVVAIIIAPLFMPAIQNAAIHPVHYGVVSTVAVSMGLVTPPYGLCLLLASAIGKVRIHDALPDTLLLLGNMSVILVALVLLPDLTMFIPRLIARQWL